MKPIKALLAIVIMIASALLAKAQETNPKYHFHDVVPKLTTATIKVYGECGSCKHRIENVLKVNGVSSAKWDENTQVLSTIYDSKIIITDKIQQLVSAVGHDTEKFKASDNVYNSLPECCHYPRKN
jgi:mercuric ion binding protein